MKSANIAAKPLGLEILGGVEQLLRAALRRARLRRQQRRAARELRSLGAHTLKDIGVSRCEIQSLVQDNSGERRRTCTCA